MYPGGGWANGVYWVSKPSPCPDPQGRRNTFFHEFWTSVQQPVEACRIFPFPRASGMGVLSKWSRPSRPLVPWDYVAVCCKLVVRSTAEGRRNRMEGVQIHWWQEAAARASRVCVCDVPRELTTYESWKPLDGTSVAYSLCHGVFRPRKRNVRRDIKPCISVCIWYTRVP